MGFFGRKRSLAEDVSIATLVAKQTEIALKVDQLAGATLVLQSKVTDLLERVDANSLSLESLHMKYALAGDMRSEVRRLVDEFSRLSAEQDRREKLVERIVHWGDKLAQMHLEAKEAADGTEFTKVLQEVRGSLDGILDRMLENPELTKDHLRDLRATNQTLLEDLQRLRRRSREIPDDPEFNPTESRQT